MQARLLLPRRLAYVHEHPTLGPSCLSALELGEPRLAVRTKRRVVVGIGVLEAIVVLRLRGCFRASFHVDLCCELVSLGLKDLRDLFSREALAL